jgi:putative oxidoreductase
MIGAMALVHGSGGFFVETGGYEYVLALAAACLVIGFSGPGAVALDSLWRSNEPRRHAESAR